MALAQRYPLSAFLDNPVKAGATLSPDGTRLAYLAEEGGRLNVWVQPTHSELGGPDAVCVTHDHHRNITRYRWTGDPRWLIYEQDDDGDENWHLFRVDLDNPQTPAVNLTPYPGVRVECTLLAESPHLALVTMNKRDVEWLDVYKLDLLTGELELVVQNPGNVGGWVLGPAGTILARINTATDEQLHVWSPDGLRELVSFDAADNPLGMWPLVITPDGTGVWVGDNRTSEHVELALIDLESGETTVLAARDGISVDETSYLQPVAPTLIADRATGLPLAVRFLGVRQEIVVLDPAFQPVLDAVTQIADGDLGQCLSDLSGRYWIVSFTNDVDPDATYLYDHETGDARLLYRPYPALDPAELVPMRPVTITARDGLTLPGFLHLPKGLEPRSLPLVLFPHGGPWSRDRWGYSSRAQILANRGYAVLQVNFRGSTGFGKSFITAAVHQFAGTMHDDLIDAAEWAVKEGIADPSRIAIFGGSYGGYSALVAATFTPDYFACAIDFCGISDLPRFQRVLPIHLRHRLGWELYIGNPDIPEQEADMLARSPITRVDDITRPLLVIHGSKDARVLQEESDTIVERLRARGADVEYVLKPDEGHGFVNPENNIAMFEAIETFLARTIGTSS